MLLSRLRKGTTRGGSLLPVVLSFLLNVAASFAAAQEPHSFSSSDPLVAATFFYWYDDESGMHLRNFENGQFEVNVEPYHVTEGNRTPGYSWKNPEWIRHQLLDMREAGIDIAAIVWFGHEPEHSWADDGLRNVLEVALELEQAGLNPPKLALFYDTSAFTFEEANRNPGKSWTLDLTTPENKDRFYEMAKRFFCIVCEVPYQRSEAPLGLDLSRSRFSPVLARIDGLLPVPIYEAGRGNFFSDWDHSLFDHMLSRFEQDFAFRPRLFPDYEWWYKNPHQRELPFDLNGGGYVRWRAAVYEPFSMDEPIALPRKGMDAIQFGPGYDDRRFPGRTVNGSPVRSRDNGYFYAYGWQYAQRSGKKLVMLESWNELHEGTAVCESRQYGRSYVHMTRRGAEEFKRSYRDADQVWCRLTGRNEDGLNIINDEHGLYQVDGGVLRSSDQPWEKEETDYLFDAPPATDGKSVATWKNGSECRRTDLPRHNRLYFDLRDEFTSATAGEALWVAVEYSDTGFDRFRLLWADGSAGSEPVRKQNSGAWKRHVFEVPASGCVNGLGTGLNHMIYQKLGCDLALDAMKDGNEHVRLVSVHRSRHGAEAFAQPAEARTVAGTLRIQAPSLVEAGKPFKVRAVATLADGTTDTSYRGTVRVRGMNQWTTAPESLQFAAADAGVREFEVAFGRYGPNVLQVQDPMDLGRRARADILVPIPRCELAWDERGTRTGLSLVSEAAGQPEGPLQQGFSTRRHGGSLTFDADDNAYFALGGYGSYYNLYVTFDYLDRGRTPFTVSYDSNDAFDPPAGEKLARTQPVERYNTNRWRRATVFLEDPYFANRCRNGDFTVNDGGDDLVVRRVRVSTAPPDDSSFDLNIQTQPAGVQGSLVTLTATEPDSATSSTGERRIRLFSDAFTLPAEITLNPADGGTTTFHLPVPPASRIYACDSSDPSISCSTDEEVAAAPAASCPSHAADQARPKRGVAGVVLPLAFVAGAGLAFHFQRRAARRAGRLSATGSPALLRPYFASALLSLLFLAPRFVSDSRFLMGDYWTFHGPNRVYCAQALRSLRLPHWAGEIFCGYPLLSDPQTAFFYPGNLILSLLSSYPGTSQILDWYVIAHVVLAGLGGVFLARSFGMGSYGAVVAGLVASLNGYTVQHLGHLNILQSLALAFWSFGCLARALTAGNVRWAACGGLLLSCVVLAGHPQMGLLTFYTAAAGTAIFAVIEAVRQRSLARLRSAALLAGLMFVIAIAGAAVQLLPASQLIDVSARNRLTLDEAMVFHFPARQWLQLFLPHLYSLHTWMIPSDLRWNTVAPGWAQPGLHEYAFHGGLTAGLLGLIGLAINWRRAAAHALFWSSLVVWVAATGPDGHLYPILFEYLPGFSQTRIPARLLWISWMCWGLLAGMGVDALLGRLCTSSAQRSGAKRRIVAIFAGSTLLLSAAAALLALLVSRYSEAQLSALLKSLRASDHFSLGHSLSTDLVRRNLAHQFTVAAAAGGVIGLWFLAARILLLRFRSGATQFGLGAVLVALLFAELFFYGGYKNIASGRGGFDLKDVPLYRALAGTPDRVTVFNKGESSDFHPEYACNPALAHGVNSAAGYNVLVPSWHAHLAQLGLGNPMAIPAPILDLMNLDTIAVRKTDAVSTSIAGHEVRLDRVPWVEIAAGDGLRASRTEFPVPAECSSLAAVHLVSTALNARQLNDGFQIGTAEFVDSAGQRIAATAVRIGHHTAEWSRSANTGAQPAHGEPQSSIARSYDASIDPAGRFYIGRLENPTTASIAAVRIYMTPESAAFLAISHVVFEPHGGQPVVSLPGQLQQLPLAGPLAQELDVFRRKSTPGYAWMVPQSEAVSHKKQMHWVMKKLLDPDHDIARIVLLDKKAARNTSRYDAPDRGSYEGTAQLRVGASPEHYSVITEANQRGWLVLSQTWYPGWQATVDGVPVPLHQANGAFCAVPVPEGKHVVEMRFWTPRLVPGFLVSAATWIAATGVMLGLLRRRNPARANG